MTTLQTVQAACEILREYVTAGVQIVPRYAPHRMSDPLSGPAIAVGLQSAEYTRASFGPCGNGAAPNCNCEVTLSVDCYSPHRCGGLDCLQLWDEAAAVLLEHFPGALTVRAYPVESEADAGAFVLRGRVTLELCTQVPQTGRSEE